ncbi:ABC transporter substrate-binding protein [Bradyrhizobium mercantei]|uniref:ABC transporter substrate-binding protein n=1 Tax=Bradyrhizobium mercantei TaxID=1904807 RepID=UPI0009760FD1|nr:ABC transporter substrate-binding protein [Bradyrhizobium mercantei]
MFSPHFINRVMAITITGLLFLGAQCRAAETVKIGVLGTTSDLPMYLALQEGFFEKEGLSLEIVPFKSGAQMVAPLGTGQLDIAAGIVAAGLYNLSNRGVEFKIVSDRGSMRPGFGYYRLLLRKDIYDSGRYKGYADLKGLRIGTQSKGGPAESTLNQVLKLGGLSYEDIDPTYLGHSDMIAALANKAIDAGFFTEPHATFALKSGSGVEIARGDKVDPNGNLGVMIYADSFMKKRSKAADGFMRAFLRGCRLVNDAYRNGQLDAGPLGEKVIKAYLGFFEVKDASLIRAMNPSGCDPDGRPDLGKLQEAYAFFKGRGLIQGKTEVKDLLDFEFADRASKALGPYNP